ncbi:MAG: hypothetical protein JNL32_15540, partial [Candidatus Kapabacteria bacterium]|nr:hypothetical protein [Candidatus Kapabacteria bacterium]
PYYVFHVIFLYNEVDKTLCITAQLAPDAATRVSSVLKPKKAAYIYLPSLNTYTRLSFA